MSASFPNAYYCECFRVALGSQEAQKVNYALRELGPAADFSLFSLFEPPFGKKGLRDQ
jgi:hypothetical protein